MIALTLPMACRLADEVLERLVQVGAQLLLRRAQRPTSRRDGLSARAEDTVAISFSFCQGLRMKSVAPALIALTAISTSP